MTQSPDIPKKTPKFNRGRPPFAGWWLCRNVGADSFEAWRWWNGRHWSHAVESEANWLLAKSKSARQSWRGIREIRWSTYWPANARVPRINPENQT